MIGAPQRPVLRLVEPAPKPRMAPPPWMLAPPIPAEINSLGVNEPQQPYLPIAVSSLLPVSSVAPVAAAVADVAPYRNIREVPRLG